MSNLNLFGSDPSFEKIVKRAKKHSLLKTIFISFVVCCVTLVLLLAIGTYVMERNYEKSSTQSAEEYIVKGANVQMTGSTATAFFIAKLANEPAVKFVGEIPIPWQENMHLFTVLGTHTEFRKNELYHLPNGAAYLNGHRMIEFVPSHLQATHSADSLLERIDDKTLVEIALSFDQPYDPNFVEETFQPHLVWNWVDAENVRVIGDEAYGFQYLSDDMENSINAFKVTAEGLMKRDREYERLQNVISNDVKISGVVLTGTYEEVRPYLLLDVVKYISVGVTIRE